MIVRRNIAHLVSYAGVVVAVLLGGTQVTSNVVIRTVLVCAAIIAALIPPILLSYEGYLLKSGKLHAVDYVSRSAIRRLSKDLGARPPGEVRIGFLESSRGCQALASDFRKALQATGWIVKDVRPRGWIGSGPCGISVSVADTSSTLPHSAATLLAALARAGIDAGPAQLGELADGEVELYIGQPPTPQHRF